MDETARRAEPALYRPSPPPGPAHLADPRAVQILSTEHWSLLTARSLVYNEAFTRCGMFLTLLSASLVALGFVYQGSSGGPDFPMIVAAVLAVDLFVGLATLGRIVRGSMEEFRSLQAMNRIRHAYLEMVPTLAPYFSVSSYDDADSVLEVYATSVAQPSTLRNIGYGLTTMPGMIGALNAALAAGLAGAIVIALTGDSRAALLVAAITGVVTLAVITVFVMRMFTRVGRFFETRFPAPGREP